MSDFQLAWRNLWRNRKRTLITSASVFFAVFFALLMRSFELGTYDHMFKNMIESYTGYLQVQNADFASEPVIDNGFELSRDMVSGLENDRNISEVIPRIESFALAAGGNRTQGVIVMGIDPEAENRVSGIKNRLVNFRFTPEIVQRLGDDSIPARTKKLLGLFENESYSGRVRMMLDLGISKEDSASVMPVLRKHAAFRNGYLISGEQGVIIGDKLSVYLGLNVGDTLIMIGQGYHGSTAAGRFPVKGIVKLPAPDIDNKIVYMPISTAQQFYDAPSIITSAVIGVKDNSDEAVTETFNRISPKIPLPLKVITWQEMNEILINQMDADNSSGILMIGILYLVIAFGVFGTVLMMMSERKREFGMLVSIGMQKKKLAKVVSTEMLLIGLIGVLSGIIASLPVVFFGNSHPLRFTGQMAKMYEDYGFEPVMPTMLPDIYYLWQTVVVLIILAIAIIFSVRKIYKMDVVKSLRT
jgi:ABC-type lipoprotein release transport system permease subunit